MKIPYFEIHCLIELTTKEAAKKCRLDLAGRAGEFVSLSNFSLVFFEALPAEGFHVSSIGKIKIVAIVFLYVISIYKRTSTWTHTHAINLYVCIQFCQLCNAF